MKYVLVWVVLLVLTGLSYLASRLALGGLDVPVALGIATVKASLVAIVFMHLGEDRSVIRIVLLIAVGFTLLLVGGVVADVGFRAG